MRLFCELLGAAGKAASSANHAPRDQPSGYWLAAWDEAEGAASDEAWDAARGGASYAALYAASDAASGAASASGLQLREQTSHNTVTAAPRSSRDAHIVKDRQTVTGHVPDGV